MALSTTILSPVLLVCGAVIYAFGLLRVRRTAPWSWYAREGAANRFAATTLAVLIVWQLCADPYSGPAVHLLGATLLTLAFGWR